MEIFVQYLILEVLDIKDWHFYDKIVSGKCHLAYVHCETAQSAPTICQLFYSREKSQTDSKERSSEGYIATPKVR